MSQEPSSLTIRYAFAAIFVMLLNVCFAAICWNNPDHSWWWLHAAMVVISILSLGYLACSVIISFNLLAPCLGWFAARRSYRKLSSSIEDEDSVIQSLKEEIHDLEAMLNAYKMQFPNFEDKEEYREGARALDTARKNYERLRSQRDESDKKLPDFKQGLSELGTEYFRLCDSIIPRQVKFLKYGIVFFVASFILGTIESMITDCEPTDSSTPDSTYITNWPTSFDRISQSLNDIARAIENGTYFNGDTLHPPTYICYPCSTSKISSESTDKALNRIAQAIENLVDSQTSKPIPAWIINSFLWIGIGLLVLSSIRVYMLRNEASKRKATWELLRNLSLTSTLIGTLLSIDKFTVSIGDINICSTGEKTVIAPSHTCIEFTKIGTIDSFSTANSIVPDLDTLNSIAMALMDSNWKLLTIRLIGRADKRELNGQIEKYFESNLNLGRQRAIAVRDALLDRCKQNYPPGLNVNLFVIESDGADHVSAPPESLMKRDRAVDVYVVREAKPDILPPHEYRKCECGKHECTKHKH